jgi:hypothetical protein
MFKDKNAIFLYLRPNMKTRKRKGKKRGKEGEGGKRK